MPRSEPIILGRGAYTVRLAPSGASDSTWQGIALTPPLGDVLAPSDGFTLLARDIEDPLARFIARGDLLEESADLSSASSEQCVMFVQHAVELDVTLLVAAPLGVDGELRRVLLRNLGARRRKIELTAYLEVALNQPAAHEAHPAFSKLFVQTERDAESGHLLARRRPRGNDERHPWLALGQTGGEIRGFETDRGRLLGRGRTLRRALMRRSDPLEGTLGNVLDPALALRVLVVLAPGETKEISFAAAAGIDRDSVLRQLEAALGASIEAPRTPVMRHAQPRPALIAARSNPADPSSFSTEPLVEWNGIGGFSARGDEYVLRLPIGSDGVPTLPPRPWCNVIANDSFGCLISEVGAGCVWSRNSREHRITPWTNDPLVDPPNDAIYLRDEDSGDLWSPLPAPLPNGRDYEVRHGIGFTRFHHVSMELEQETTCFVPPNEPVRVLRLTLRNRSRRTRRIRAAAYARLVLGVLPENQSPIVTEVVGAASDLLAWNPRALEFSDGVAFAALRSASSVGAPEATTDRSEFLGECGGLEAPAALLRRSTLTGRDGEGLDPCFAQIVLLEIGPGETATLDWLLGEAIGKDAAIALLQRLTRAGEVDRALAETREQWDRVLSRLRIDTPSRDLDTMVNAWLPYQVLSCRLWARTALYQSGGAFGFRDQLQDAASLLLLDPRLTREQLLLHASHQFVEGDVLHWWHPPLSKGIRTRFADDLLWLPYLTAYYVQATGDRAVLGETVPFLTAARLDEGEDERFLTPTNSGTQADLYEHCCRALDRSLTRGAHGLPLFGTGDWNDGMNRVGREGRGESVWMAFFLYKILGDFLPLARSRNDDERAERYDRVRSELRQSIEAHAWDGAWYRRGYYDSGAPLGSRDSDECKIDALAQAWAVLSGAADPERARQAMASAEEHLVSEREGLIRLLTPPFEHTAEDPGYIKGYVAGVRENGGQYTHGALWVIKALGELGRHEQAARLLEMIGPMHHSRTPEAVARYQVEPYVIAADVYGASPHVGRGGWTWYTGSAGWMYRIAIETILGLTMGEGTWLRLKPCVPLAWKRFHISYRLPGEDTCYRIEVRNPDSSGAEVLSATVDDQVAPVDARGAMVNLVHDGREHQVVVNLGTRIRP